MSHLVLLLPLLAGDVEAKPAPELGAERVYQVRQTTFLQEVPEGARNVRWWIAIPDDERFQDVLELDVVSAPGPWRIERDLERRNRFLLVEVERPAAGTLETVLDFTLRRQPVLVEIDPERVGPIDDDHRRLFADELDTSAAHMRASSEITRIAREICGEEENPARTVRKLLDWVADNADHYSKDASKPKCGVGDAQDCLTNGGGCCTDLHSLFIALARARGIPARLQMGYRLLEKNDGKEVDPGYRCWVEFFLPGAGWVPSDIVEADAPDGLGRERWFRGLTERRLWLNEGRDFRFPSADSAEPVNTMSIGYAEIDGRPARVLPEGELAAQLTRKVRFTEIRPALER